MVKIVKRSTVATDKSDVHFKVTIEACLKEQCDEPRLAIKRKNSGVSMAPDLSFLEYKSSLEKRPVVVGFGPAGIFAALILAEAGARPIVLERGFEVEQREKDIDSFKIKRLLSPESNIQFGEGGAGAFSDGKLKVGALNADKNKILTELVAAGAPESILYLEKAHIGSDRLPLAVKNLRRKIISLGGEVIFGAKFSAFTLKNGKICSVRYVRGGAEEEIETDRVILACGHSARDTFEYLYADGVEMKQKGFGVGVRIEHPQALINEIQYGSFKDNPLLGSADYKLVTHLSGGRSVYTFCMCPGGYVVGASSEKGRICTNGMSLFARDSLNANAAMLVSVTPSDFLSEHPLAGIEYQRKIEERAFLLAGENYFAPVQRLEDFMEHRQSKELGAVKPSYLPGTALISHDDYLPAYIAESLRAGLSDMFSYMKGYYYPDAVLTGPETRTTSPVVVVRKENLESATVQGLYPCGEGAGYAGGILSAATDGIRCAAAVLNKL